MDARLKKASEYIEDKILSKSWHYKSFPKGLSLVSIRDVQYMIHELKHRQEVTTIDQTAKNCMESFGFKTEPHGIGWKITF